MKNMKKRGSVALVVCLMLAVCLISIGGTIAWLTDSTDPVVNTFSPTDIDVTLEETTPALVDGSRNVQIIPGVDIAKDPKVSAESDVPYYLFVKVTEANWTVPGVAYEIAGGWTKLEGATLATGETVYYMDQDTGTAVNDASILKNDVVTVSEDLTKEQMENITGISLTFKAYAIQKAKSSTADFTALEAWIQLNPTNP